MAFPFREGFRNFAAGAGNPLSPVAADGENGVRAVCEDTHPAGGDWAAQGGVDSRGESYQPLRSTPTERGSAAAEDRLDGDGGAFSAADFRGVAAGD